MLSKAICPRPSTITISRKESADTSLLQVIPKPNWISSQLPPHSPTCSSLRVMRPFAYFCCFPLAKKIFTSLEQDKTQLLINLIFSRP
jgi:hypothetical protein